MTAAPTGSRVRAPAPNTPHGGRLGLKVCDRAQDPAEKADYLAPFAAQRVRGRLLTPVDATGRNIAAFRWRDMRSSLADPADVRGPGRDPDEVAIVGYDDIECVAAAAVPLTSVRQPAVTITRWPSSCSGRPGGGCGAGHPSGSRRTDGRREEAGRREPCGREPGVSAAPADGPVPGARAGRGRVGGTRGTGGGGAGCRGCFAAKRYSFCESDTVGDAGGPPTAGPWSRSHPCLDADQAAGDPCMAHAVPFQVRDATA